MITWSDVMFVIVQPFGPQVFFSFLKDSEILFSDSIPDGNFLLKFSHFEVDSCLFRSGL